ncbi:MAG: hypothetical protein HC906_18580 [Bacteroidales bacterium]|nr:hypothetical protein [Bacteroidales bacterium]
MKEIAEILKYILPSLVVFFTVYFLVRNYFRNEGVKSHEKSHLQNLEIITPLRLQAYERLVLFLERITLENLLIRVNKPGLTSSQLHTELLSNVRAEFEYNLSQQIYVSGKAWEMIKNARTNTIHLINMNAEKIKPDSPAINLSKAILEHTMRQEKLPTIDAINFLKNELNRII